MDLNLLVKYAEVVNDAYKILPGDLTDLSGTTRAIAVPASIEYSVISTIYACDLATETNPERGQNRVSIGLILQEPNTGEVVIPIRGTEGIWEWIHDVQLLLVSCPIAGSSGSTEDGFSSMYKSLTVEADSKSETVVQALNSGTLQFPRPVTSLTICGHSLGGSLATLLALDLAINTQYKTPNAYTFASPRCGDPTFVNVYNHVVPNTARVANRIDLVPKLPLPPLYEHVLGLFDLSSIKLGIPPSLLVKPTIPCDHYMSSYLFLLGLLAGVPLQLEAQCIPGRGQSLAESSQLA